jgi:hypothetical protein
MTYYSDLLLVLSELEALQFGKPPKRPAEELRALCVSILEIDPDEELAGQLLAALNSVPATVSRNGFVAILRDKAATALKRAGFHGSRA